MRLFQMRLLLEVRNETSFGVMKLLSDLSEVQRYRTTVSMAMTAVT